MSVVSSLNKMQDLTTDDEFQTASNTERQIMESPDVLEETTNATKEAQPKMQTRHGKPGIDVRSTQRDSKQPPGSRRSWR